MSPDHAPKKLTTAPIAAGDFPALRSFLRGYFHQDMKDEYGSPEEAVREFCADASAEERTQVAEEWSRFLRQTKGWPTAQVNAALTSQLGSSCAITDEDLKGISSVFETGRK
jgi:hypothetical protein